MQPTKTTTQPTRNRSNTKWRAGDIELLRQMMKQDREASGRQAITGETLKAWGRVFGRSPKAVQLMVHKVSKAQPQSKPQDVRPQTYPTSMRLPDKWLTAADSLADKLNEQGAFLAFGRLDRSTVLRLAIQRGLAVMAEDLDG